VEQLREIFSKMADHWLWGTVLGIITYLVEPTAAFYALWIAVFLDLVSKVVALAVKHGGLIRATKLKVIDSHTMFYRAFLKVLAYFSMTVLAHQSKAIVGVESVSIAFSTIIYCILFLVEVYSIIENFVEAGVEDLRLLLIRFKREKEKIIEGEEDLVCDMVTKGEDKRGPTI